MQIWYWTLSGSALPASLVGTTDRNTLDPILFIPPSPILVASFPTDSLTFCCPSVLKALPETTKTFPDGLVRRLKWIASPFSESGLIEIVCVCLPPLATDLVVNHKVYFQSPETFFTRVTNFQAASENNMPMALKLYSNVCADSENSLECFLLIAFEDGSLQWHMLGLDQQLEAIQMRHQLLWEITRLHSVPILAVVVSEDKSFGFSVCLDGKLARFNLDYSGAELAKIQDNDQNAPKLSQPILEPPSLESHSITMKQLDSGGSCATIRNGTIAIGHLDNNIGIYSISDMQLIRKLNFHREKIAHVFYFDGSDCIAKTLKTSSNFLFAASQDSRISLWEALEP
ncbi:Astra associated protein 1 Asa1 [Entomophthora muscae]|uniref:Astra associated protein 1 Asa1 n=1 Tax=Entomophthora muscae TaxID=34485 RepID=A0ACC2TCD9_9FUNG|nr:Astra associated protein 1 Asa1 [Entomophthora muscae]